MLSSLAKKTAFSFSIMPLTGTFCSLADKNHLYIHLSKLSFSAVFSFSRFGFFPDSNALTIFSLFFN